MTSNLAMPQYNQQYHFELPQQTQQQQVVPEFQDNLGLVGEGLIIPVQPQQMQMQMQVPHTCGLGCTCGYCVPVGVVSRTASFCSSNEGVPSIPPSPTPGVFRAAVQQQCFRHDPYAATSTAASTPPPTRNPSPPVPCAEPQQPRQPIDYTYAASPFADPAPMPMQPLPVMRVATPPQQVAPLCQSPSVSSTHSQQNCGLSQSTNSCADSAGSLTPPHRPLVLDAPPARKQVRAAAVAEKAAPAVAGQKARRNVLVEYKHGRKGVCTLPSGTVRRRYESDPNKYIVVEGDRGVDICRIISTTVRKSADAPGLKHPLVLREATDDEVAHWQGPLTALEAEACTVVNTLVRNASLPLVVTHAAYQLDKKKLTFIYESEQHQPDFRCLLAECYAHWKCRIWFTCLPKKLASNGNNGPRSRCA